MCGESRMHGDNGGDGKTQLGCASCPYPLLILTNRPKNERTMSFRSRAGEKCALSPVNVLLSDAVSLILNLF